MTYYLAYCILMTISFSYETITNNYMLAMELVLRITVYITVTINLKRQTNFRN